MKKLTLVTIPSYCNWILIILSLFWTEFSQFIWHDWIYENEGISELHVILLFFSNEILIFFSILIGFFIYLFFNKRFNSIFEYLQFLIYQFIGYFVNIIYIYIRFPLFKSFNFFNGTLLIDNSTFMTRLIICFFCIMYFLLMYIHIVNSCFYALEIPFIIAILFWFFIISVFSANFLFLFLLMEIITLSVTVLTTLFFVVSSGKLVKPVIQFFILNLLISTFYLLAVSLLLYCVPNQRFYTISYTTIWTHFFNMENEFEDLTSYFIFMKIILLLIYLVFSFKLTLAPFSIWIINIYSNLPAIFMLIVMTIYKIVFFILLVNLTLKNISIIPLLQQYFTNLISILVLPSMFIGCLAYRNQDFKTILAYTTVSQLAYVLAGISVNNSEAAKYAFIYLLVYCLQLFGIFCIFMILQQRYDILNLNNLFMVKYYNFICYSALFIIFLSLAGIPPLAGFFIKYFLFLEIYRSGYFLMAISGLVSGFFMTIIYFHLALQLTYSKSSQTNLVIYFEYLKKDKFNFFDYKNLTSFYKIVVSILIKFLISLIIFNVCFFIFPFFFTNFFWIYEIIYGIS